MSKISYKDAGVDIDAGNSFVEAIKADVKSTFTPNVLGGIGSFAGAFALPGGYKQPTILAATDGVGTKLKLATLSKRYDTIGIDLVAMCVNDLICNFAEPIFFLDYYATAKLDIAVAKSVIRGIVIGCKQSECALIGGETAEMPGMYSGDDFDLAGFAVGIAEKEEIDRTKHLASGQRLVALPSSGIHSNGYSLVRKIFFDKLKMGLEDEFDGKPLIQTLLTPTKIYVKTFKKLKHKIKALAHITGGGLVENIPRVLDGRFDANIKESKIQTLPIFDFLGEYVEKEQMYRTFNMGVGMVLVVDANDVEFICSESGGYVIGELVEGSGVVNLL